MFTQQFISMYLISKFDPKSKAGNCASTVICMLTCYIMYTINV